MQTTHAVGIDLGTTYSCIAHLNEHGEPVTLSNQEGELATPSVVLFDGDEPIVGTEGLRNAIVHPDRVVQNSKRFIGNPNHRWMIGDKPYTPVDIAALILKKLLSAAQMQIGEVKQAVITVPAQFSDAQRHAVVEAGTWAGLERIDIINEPVAAALCYVLGSEGLWFSELAGEQRILVYDLGGGTFDLSLVRYRKNEVSVIASSGDLNLGGIDWNRALQEATCDRFMHKYKADPREDPSSMQFLALEVEQTKRSLSVRPRAALTCQHDGHRETYQIDQPYFEKLTKPFVDKTAAITERLLKETKLGWGGVDVVLTTGGASRMPMIRERLKAMSGRTINTSLSPDLSIAQGATYYAGMLLSNDKFAKSILNPPASERLAQIKQQSVNARALGILVRDTKRNGRVAHYLVPANSPLPISVTENFGTIMPNQKRVRLQIVESGTGPDKPPAKLGACVIDELPPNLPEGSNIAVSISYDAEARVHVSAKDVASGKQATTVLIRQSSVMPQLESPHTNATDEDVAPPPPPASRQKPAAPAPAAKSAPKPVSAAPQPVPRTVSATKPQVQPAPKAVKPQQAAMPKVAAPVAKKSQLEDTDRPIPLCNNCGEPLNSRGQCTACRPAAKTPPLAKSAPTKSAVPQKLPPTPPPRTAPPVPTRMPTPQPSKPNSADPIELGEKDFWKDDE